MHCFYLYYEKALFFNGVFTAIISGMKITFSLIFT